MSMAVSNSSNYDSIEQVFPVANYPHNPDLGVFHMLPFADSSETASLSHTKGAFERTSQSPGGAGTSTTYNVTANTSTTFTGLAEKIYADGIASNTISSGVLSNNVPFCFTSSLTVDKI